jgi:UDP-N-acetylmuramyl pentapeptide phosphotransferase/UDP-N-acetylglucosamine-1-phosphate transferase
MLNVLLTSSASFIITFLAVPAIIKIARAKKLYDIPDERKLHTRPIASLGGIGIFVGFFIASLLSISFQSAPEFQYFFAAATAIFFLGLKDDILILTAMKKFIGQMIAAAILIHLGGIRIESMHGLFGYDQLPGLISLALSYVSIIVIINAFNLIDGIDGLAGSLGFLTMSIFGVYFFMVDMSAYALFAFSMAGSIAAFLIFNYHPAKIFMGDSGSLLLGLVNAILVIKFIGVADSSAVAYPLESAVAIGVAILMLPLADTLRVFSIRLLKGRSPFVPDRNHIHHLLLDRGLSHKYITICCVLLNTMFIAIAYFGRQLGPTYIILTISLVSCGFLSVLFFVIKPVRKVAMGRSFQLNAEPLATSTTKVVSINSEAAVLEN